MKKPSIKILLSTGTLYKKPPWIAAEIASRVGFDGVELVLGYGFQDSDGEKEIEATLKQAPILSLHAPFYRLRGWGKPFESLQKTILLADRHFIPLITFHPPRWLDLEFGFYRTLNRIKNFQKSFGEESLAITMENMPVSHGFFRIAPYFFSNPATLISFVEAHNLFITLDATHLGTRERDFPGEVDLLLSSGRVRNVPPEWIRKQTLVSAERYITEELKEYETKILGAEEKILKLESELFSELVQQLSNYIPVIQQNAALISKLDCLNSFAVIAKRYKYNRPVIDDSEVIDIKQGRHPVIEQQLPLDEKYIPNDVYLDSEKQQIII